MNKIPTVMFHSIGLSEYKWVFPWISDTKNYFESVIRYLSRKGYKSHFFSSGIYEESKCKKDVVLTFDDGYLDNYLIVFPILKKYGMKGTIFVNTDFAVKDNVTRNNDDGIAGFLSYAEMRELEDSGVMEIQSHSKTHTWYFSGKRIVDYWRPGISTERNGPVWMLWNKFPEFKPFYLTKAAEYERRIPYGTPIYEHSKALVCTKYNHDQNLDAKLIDYVNINGYVDYFKRPHWRDELDSVVKLYGNDDQCSSSEMRFETEDERKVRIHEELLSSKKVLEHELGKPISCLCWPGGGVDQMTFDIAKKVGYTRFTRPSAWRENHDPEFCTMIERIGGGAKLEYLNNKSTPWEIGYRMNRYLGNNILAIYYGANILLRTKKQG